MALLDDIAAPTPVGLAIGLGAAVLGPRLAPALRGVMRPAAVAVLRTGINAWRSVSGPGASLAALVAEAQIELAVASAHRVSPPPNPSPLTTVKARGTPDPDASVAANQAHDPHPASRTGSRKRRRGTLHA